MMYPSAAAAPSPGATLLAQLLPVVRQHLPPGITPAYLDGFVTRNRPALVAALDRALASRTQPPAGPPPPELWTPSQRTAANLKAMEIAAAKHPEAMTAEDRTALAAYSGWGGLSIDAVRDRFPPGFPIPEQRGLVHEYYTPSRVCAEVARVVRPLLPELSVEGRVLALEPSAGIGRFVRALTGPGFEPLHWLTVEWSDLSARMLQAIRPDLALYTGPFERWVREHGSEYQGRLNLVLANPPYGARGAAVTDDPDRSYREKQAWAYFLRRGLDLLAPQGLGVYLIPAGFLSGRTARHKSLREKVLLRHHLAAAYRLPSVAPNGREALFPGAMLVTDLIFFRARGGSLEAVDEDDAFILDGRYFEQFPGHILGRELGRDAGDDDQTAKPRFGYQVQGTFTRLPDLVERAVCGACEIRHDAPARAVPQASGGVTRDLRGDTAGLTEDLHAAVTLGLRADRYLATVAREETEEPLHLWAELKEALEAWASAYGNPYAHKALRKLVATGSTGAERFLSSFSPAGKLIPGLAEKPVFRPRYQGKPDDAVALAEFVYRTRRRCSIEDLAAAWHGAGWSQAAEPVRDQARRAVLARLGSLFEAGWCLDGKGWTQLLPGPDYASGHLWPRFDRAQAALTANQLPAWLTSDQLAAQVRALRDAIEPAVFDDIGGVSARQGWLPLALVSAWISQGLNKRYGAVELVRDQGLVQVAGQAYEDIDSSRLLSPEARWCVGWMNHDKTVFKPKRSAVDGGRRQKKDEQQSLDEVRLKLAQEWDQSFRAWVASDESRKAQVEEAYNRQFRGYRAPSWSSEPLPIARWVKDGIRLHPHQVAGARRILANRGGLLAFDVGVGKTYTGIAVLAQARQEGWCRRPVILVPNSIVWKWEADLKRVLPDYRVGVIGSRKKLVTRGARKGLVTSETDSPQERARKWTRFQAGEFDVVLLTYTALARTRMNEDAVKAYADETEAIRREVKLRQRNALDSKKLTERQEAILKEGVSAWVAEQLELPPPAGSTTPAWPGTTSASTSSSAMRLRTSKTCTCPRPARAASRASWATPARAASGPGSSTSAVRPCAARPGARACCSSPPPPPRTARSSSTTSSSSSTTTPGSAWASATPSSSSTATCASS
ncbi:MAG: SNF2-related protein [Pseudomonadota bacterium]